MATKKAKISMELQEGLEVPQIDVLTDLLIRERRSVLFVGEGDFTFTVAYAALRKSERASSSPIFNPGTWDGIIASRYESEHKERKPVFIEVLATCRVTCNCCDSPGTRRKKMQMLDELVPPPENSWKYGINAWHLTEFKHYCSDVIWFQCHGQVTPTRLFYTSLAVHPTFCNLAAMYVSALVSTRTTLKHMI